MRQGVRISQRQMRASYGCQPHLYCPWRFGLIGGAMYQVVDDQLFFCAIVRWHEPCRVFSSSMAEELPPAPLRLIALSCRGGIPGQHQREALLLILMPSLNGSQTEWFFPWVVPSCRPGPPQERNCCFRMDATSFLRDLEAHFLSDPSHALPTPGCWHGRRCQPSSLLRLKEALPYPAELPASPATRQNEDSRTPPRAIRLLGLAHVACSRPLPKRAEDEQCRWQPGRAARLGS